MCVLLASLCMCAPALDLTLEGSGTASTETPNPVWLALDMRAVHELKDFSFLWDVSVSGDGHYGGLFGGSSPFGNATVMVREGGLLWHSGRFNISAGRLAMHDEVDSPYSLFMSSRGNAALNVLFRYEDDRFFFSDRWVALNYNSVDTAWPDRSAVIKNYGMKFGDLRVGFQDALVFTDKALLDWNTSPPTGGSRTPVFDPNYFFNPAPGILLQYAATSADAPWQTNPALNDNTVLGFFAVLNKGDMAYDAQILIDDINTNRFVHPNSFQNPDKIAWGLGASMHTDHGLFGLNTAGATKYTFEPAYDGSGNTDYGYTFYPDTQFMLRGVPTAIDPESTYLGYLHGENNLAFMASWNSLPGRLSGKANLEFTISGSKSPANPWGALLVYSDGGQGTKFLNDAVLEKKLVLGGRTEFLMGDWLFYADAMVGWVWNRLKLTSVTNDQQTTEPDHLMGVDRINGIPIYYPSSESSPIGSLTLGVKLLLK